MTRMTRITRPFGGRAAGIRAGIGVGVALALVGALVGTATGAVTPFQKVLVVNAPASPIPVVGTVNVGNAPANQNVSVTNFPATQAVSGSVSIGDLPRRRLRRLCGNPAEPSRTRRSATSNSAGRSTSAR